MTEMGTVPVMSTDVSLVYGLLGATIAGAPATGPSDGLDDGLVPVLVRKLETAPPMFATIRPICPVAEYRMTAPRATTARARIARPMNGMPGPLGTFLCWEIRYGDGRGRSF